MRPAAFLDRDGTIIEDAHYLADPAGVRLLPGAAAAIRSLNEAGVPVVIATNQSGIGRGFFGEADFLATQQRLLDLLAAEGARVDACFHCPHAPEDGCDCRKPLPGLFLRAARELGLDLATSWFVGDRLRDVEPGVRLGGTAILLCEGAHAAPADVHVVPTLPDAVRLIDRHLQGL